MGELIVDKTNNKYLVLVTSILIVIILVSCGTINSNHPTVSPVAIGKVTETPLKEITITPRLTDTMEPTLAYWATAQENRFNDIYTHIAETKIAIVDLSTQFPQFCGFDFESVFTSPDGKWIADDCQYFAGGEFHVFSKVDNKTWIIPYSKVFENYPNDVGSIDALHWSKDGKYLYFTNDPCCPHTDTLSNGNTLFVLDLQTGTWKPIVKGYFNYFLFSPVENRLVYIICSQANANTKIDLHVLDLSTGQEELIHIGNFEQAGYATWSPNGQQIALFAQIGNMYDENQKYSLVTMNILGKTSKTIILNAIDPSYVINWSEDDILTIKRNKLTQYSESLAIRYYEISYYDLKNQEFISNMP